MVTENSEMERLENILDEVSEAIVICDPYARILLFNPQAKKLFKNSPSLNLGHSLYGLCHRTPLEHAFRDLQQTSGDGSRYGADGRESWFVCSTICDTMLLQCHLRFIPATTALESAFVLDFTHIMYRIDEAARRGNLLSKMIEDLRGPLTNLHAAAANLQTHPSMPVHDRIEFENIIAAESDDLIQRFASVVRESRLLSLVEWPLAEVYSADLVRCVVQKLNKRSGIKATMVGIPLWLQADPYSMTLALECLVLAVQNVCNQAEIDIEVLPGERSVYFDIIWQGQPVPQEVVASWFQKPLAAISENITVADVLERHNSDMWCQRHRREGYALLRIPAPASRRQGRSPVDIAEDKPELYDFYATVGENVSEEMKDTPLSSLAYVVFKTETSGFDPSEDGDITALAGVKIVRRRIISDEIFYSLVNPYRPIDENSVRLHGINNDAVKGSPPVKVVLSDFRSFVGDAVLVGHNAGFDMQVIRLQEEKSEFRFDNILLDTLLLSVIATEKTQRHNCGAPLHRLGDNIIGHCTVMDDCLATAQTFLDCLDLLETAGITTLGQALTASKSAAAQRVYNQDDF